MGLLTNKQLKELGAVSDLAPGFQKQGKLGSFFDLWIVCEVLAKKYIVYHKQLSTMPFQWQYTQLTAALNSFSVSYIDTNVQPVFQSGNKNKRGEKSARQLRNGYIHSLSKEDRKEIEDRYTELATNLKYWIEKLSNPSQ